MSTEETTETPSQPWDQVTLDPKDLKGVALQAVYVDMYTAKAHAVLGVLVQAKHASEMNSLTIMERRGEILVKTFHELVDRGVPAKTAYETACNTVGVEEADWAEEE